MEPTPQPETTPPSTDLEGALPAGLIDANGLLDGLAGDEDGRPLAEHAEVFEVVHQALLDALAQTEA